MKRRVFARFLLPLAGVPLLGLLATACSNNENSITAKNLTPFAYNGKVIDVIDEAIFFTPESYNGQFWTGNKTLGRASETMLQPMPHTRTIVSKRDVAELGDKDFFYVVYDNDLNDGATIENFQKSFAIVDSGTYEPADQASDIPPMNSFNLRMGNIVNPFFRKEVDAEDNYATWTALYSLFDKDGISNPYLTQSNAVRATFDDALKSATANMNESEKAEFEGLFSGSSTLSKAFKPLVVRRGAFTAERVASNALKVTFHYAAGLDESQVALGFVLGDLQNIKTSTRYYAFATGDASAWDPYEASDDYTFFARKNQYLTPPAKA